MSFSSATFLLYFLPTTIILYYLMPKNLKKAYLLFISIIFYLYQSIQNTILLIGLIIYNYFASKRLFQDDSKTRKYKLIKILFVNIFLLCYFKYYFLILDKLTLSISYKSFLLPLGFSFYIFSIISYVIDIYTRKIKEMPTFLDVALYISFFPKLLMGPIIRFQDFLEETKILTPDVSHFNQGFKRLTIGLAMKLILADTFLTIITNLNATSFVSSLLLMLSYSLQLYFDFAGYTNMAIGISNIFGINLEENFNYPYIASSISDFWRRWHMTLGRFFKDYVYIPLGGNRHGKLKLIRNTLIVWLLTGMWHGATLNFIIWGLYFGILITIEKLLSKYINPPKFLTIPLTFFLVSIGWIFFFTPDINNIINILKQLINPTTLIDPTSIYIINTFLPYFILGLIFITPLMKLLGKFISKHLPYCYNILNIVYLTLLLILSISYLVSGSYQPFLYFNF